MNDTSLADVSPLALRRLQRIADRNDWDEVTAMTRESRQVALADR